MHFSSGKFSNYFIPFPPLRFLNYLLLKPVFQSYVFCMVLFFLMFPVFISLSFCSTFWEVSLPLFSNYSIEFVLPECCFLFFVFNRVLFWFHGCVYLLYHSEDVDFFLLCATLCFFQGLICLFLFVSDYLTGSRHPLDAVTHWMIGDFE